MTQATQILELKEEERRVLWQSVVSEIEAYITGLAALPVAPGLDPDALQAALDHFDAGAGHGLEAVLSFVTRHLREDQVHIAHPMYFGLFNPAPSSMGIAADALVAAFNPQLAAWSHSPFANSVESWLIREIGRRLGFDEAGLDGTFTSGGAEANHTALLTALTHGFSDFREQGLVGIDARPVLYASAHSHHSFIKAARFCGLGRNAVREVPVDHRFRMVPRALSEMIEQDRADGLHPFMVVATAGTTSCGAIDPISDCALIAEEEGCWFHVDAAWGGPAALMPEFARLFHGIEMADSVTIDAHKWLSVPMGAGIYLTTHPGALSRACGVETAYMPKDASHLQVADPFTHSMQWSRRATGMKLFMTLASAGWEGYRRVIRHQMEMALSLAEALGSRGWSVLNDPSLAVVCFVDDEPGGREADFLAGVAREIVQSGKAWISTTQLGPGVPVLRACVTSFRTMPEHVTLLVDLLDDAREIVRKKMARHA